MLQIYCSGSPTRIGEQHGSAAATEIKNGISFYQAYFQEKTKLDWISAKAAAVKFLPLLQEKCPHLIEEMKGIATGAGVPFEDILTLNCRTEIAMGLINDGCTSLVWKANGTVILAQNWDWEIRQQDNLVALHITHPGKPSLSTITEGGIVGKIGLNSAGVGVCLNAIRARGINYSRLPTHIALRTVLEHSTKAEAVSVLELAGGGTSCHILVGDCTGGVGLEFSHLDLQKLEMDGGKVVHSNHFVAPHYTPEGAQIRESVFLNDSQFRIDRIAALIATAETDGQGPTIANVEKLLDDEENFPTAINRAAVPGNGVATLFSIVMDLVAKKATVRMGRPTESIETFVLHPTA